MRTVFDRRRENLRKLISDWGGPTTLAMKLGHSNGSYLAQLAGPHPSREVGERLARSIEVKLGLPTLWMDGQTEAAPRIDDGLLAQCLQAVAVTMEESRARLTSAQQAEVVSLVYDNARRGGTLDEDFIKRLVNLTR